MASLSPSPLVEVAEIPGRGRALVAARPLRPGEVVLSEAPLLLYPSSLAAVTTFCSACFRVLPPFPIPCPSAGAAGATCPARFCSPRCAGLSHPRLLCVALHHLTSVPAPSDQLLFLLAALSLPADSIRVLLSLSPPSAAAVDLDHQQLAASYSALASLIPSHLLPADFSQGLVAALLIRDRTNAFALPEPFTSTAPQSDRQYRAFGIYPYTSLFNHDCLPNVCQFDYVDRPGDGNTSIVVRTLHAVRQGQELCLSYFAVNWGYADRQRRLLEIYGFQCECDRCRVESKWKLEEDGVDGDVEGGEDMEEECEAMEEEEGVCDGEDDGEFPHAYFFAKYLCDHENCGGTMAPLPPSTEGVTSDIMECNVCGQLKNDECLP